MAKDKLDRFADYFYISAITVSIVASISIFGWQIYYWLKYGEWIELPVAFLFEFIGINLDFVYNPSDWRGVARIAEWFFQWPLTIVIPVIGWILSTVVKNIIQSEISSSERVD